MTGLYDDIINLPHHVSATRPKMSAINRAAQFSPFAALTGHGAAIKETARLTTERIELGESEIAVLDMKLQILQESSVDRPEITVTYYEPDKRKKGGAYVTASGALKKIDDVGQVIIFVGGKRIDISDILGIECELFVDLD